MIGLSGKGFDFATCCKYPAVSGVLHDSLTFLTMHYAMFHGGIKLKASNVFSVLLSSVLIQCKGPLRTACERRCIAATCSPKP